MDQFITLVKTLTDVFNLGRLVFYPLAGVLIVAPLDLLLRLLLTSEVRPFQAQLLQDLRALGNNLPEQGALLLGSTVMGFLLAGTTFVSVISRAQDKAENESKYAFPRLYPLLRTKDENYADWLVAEYFRFLELVVHFPVAMMGTLALLDLYALSHLLLAAERSGASALLITAAATLALWLTWRLWWRKAIVAKVAHSYCEAKRYLADAVEEERQKRASTEKAALPSNGSNHSGLVTGGLVASGLVASGSAASEVASALLR
ncbi:MAG: hypothetical protein RL685_1328 [Pseudomonadota bacterium]|jgi:hypothetical protein